MAAAGGNQQLASCSDSMQVVANSTDPPASPAAVLRTSSWGGGPGARGLNTYEACGARADRHADRQRCVVVHGRSGVRGWRAVYHGNSDRMMITALHCTALHGRRPRSRPQQQQQQQWIPIDRGRMLHAEAERGHEKHMRAVNACMRPRRRTLSSCAPSIVVPGRAAA